MQPVVKRTSEESVQWKIVPELRAENVKAACTGLSPSPVSVSASRGGGLCSGLCPPSRGHQALLASLLWDLWHLLW